MYCNIQTNLTEQFYPLVTQGLDYYKAGEYYSADSCYKQADLINPNDAWLNNLRGVLASQQGLCNEANYFFSSAIKLEPDNPEYFYNLALLNYEYGELAYAERLAIKSLELEPNNATSFHLLGIIYKKEYRNDKAEGAFRTALKINPQHRKSLYEMGKQMLETHKADQAKKYFLSVLETNPDHINALYHLSYSGHFSDSENYYSNLEDSVEQNKEKGKSLARLILAKGVALHYKERFREAFSCFLEANHILIDTHTV